MWPVIEQLGEGSVGMLMWFHLMNAHRLFGFRLSQFAFVMCVPCLLWVWPCSSQAHAGSPAEKLCIKQGWRLLFWPLTLFLSALANRTELCIYCNREVLSHGFSNTLSSSPSFHCVWAKVLDSSIGLCLGCDNLLNFQRLNCSGYVFTCSFRETLKYKVSLFLRIESNLCKIKLI